MFARSNIAILGRCRLRQLGNASDQQLRLAPGRTLVVLLLLIFIWIALYFLLAAVLQQVRRWGLIGVVADKHIFVQFFLVLAVMLAFSNAILMFGSLYGRREAGFLLAMPIVSRQVIFVKWLEGLFLSSWAFMLLGVPLMLAVANNTTVHWYFYLLFVGHFFGFVALPATFGLLAAWAVAMWAPRRPFAVALWCGALAMLIAILWIINISRHAAESERWLQFLLQQISIADQPFLPSTWTANGIVAAIDGDVGRSLLYLRVVVLNTLFLAWLTVNLLGWKWSEAYSRAQHGRYNALIRRGWFTLALCWGLFFYLPRRLRVIMLKDLRGFARDPAQWTQMVIMFGLLVVYVLNLRRLPFDLSNAATKGLIAFLNLTVVSLILATFTSRFVYPLLSLEGQQLWLLGLLPIRRGTIILVKFLFAVTVTGLAGGLVMGLAIWVLRLPTTWARLNIVAVLSVCIGLCGLSVGLGARFPVFGQRNPARIASGFGGTLNLIVSMIFVLAVAASVAWVSLHEIRSGTVFPTSMSPGSVALMGALLGVSLCTAGGMLVIGGRHFDRLDYS